ncbi:hypothetical protein GCM10007919_21880 [Rhizobium indigoferae]|nr:hypothetical protein GCM10007919_21880 [Rhizobium indigoferae]
MAVRLQLADFVEDGCCLAKFRLRQADLPDEGMQMLHKRRQYLPKTIVAGLLHDLQNRGRHILLGPYHHFAPPCG